MAIEKCKTRITMLTEEEAKNSPGANGRGWKWEQGTWMGFYTFTATGRREVHEFEIGIEFSYENDRIMVGSYDIFYLVNRLSSERVSEEFYNTYIAEGVETEVFSMAPSEKAALDPWGWSAAEEAYRQSNWVDIYWVYEMCDNIERHLSVRTGQKIRDFIEEQSARRWSEEFVL